MLIDQSTEFGARVARHLREEIVVWMTTITRSGAPLPSPVWFLWDGAQGAIVYSRDSARVRNIEANPKVALNFAGNGSGGDIVILSGTAAIDRTLNAADASPVYIAKYAPHIERLGMNPASFAEEYAVPVRIEFTALRGF